MEEVFTAKVPEQVNFGLENRTGWARSSTGVALLVGVLRERKRNQSGLPHSEAADLPCQEAAEEINAYIAIRDGLMEEAEKSPTPAKLDSVAIANDCVTICVRPGFSPYGAQSLPEADALHERRRCEGYRRRIAELRALLALPSARRAA